MRRAEREALERHLAEERQRAEQLLPEERRRVAEQRLAAIAALFDAG